VIQVKTAALNQVTQHLAEVMMNWTVQAALAGRTADEVAAQGGRRLEPRAFRLEPRVFRSMEPRSSDPGSMNMPKVTFIVDGEPRILEVDLASLPYSHHGLPGSLLDIAKNLDIPLEHAAAAAARAPRATSSSARRAAPERDAGRRSGPLDTRGT